MTRRTRRTSGTGGVYYDAARGRWKGETWIKTADGGERRATVTLKAPNNTAGRRATERKLEALKRETAEQREQVSAISAMTVAAYLEDWVATTLAISETTGARRPSTVALHRWAVTKHLVPQVGRVRLARI